MGLLFDNNECKTCKILQEALDFERKRNLELTETLTSLIKPQPIINNIKEVNAIQKPIGMTFSRRRLELEKADRLRIEAEKSPYRAKSNEELSSYKDSNKTVEELEKELGVETIDEKEGA